VICAKNKVFEEIAGDAVEYFDPTYLESLKEKVEEVIYSNSRIKELKLLGKAKSENYSWGKCADETLKIYSQFTRN
jgi:glycosyltransferase involved in cell wall biosynthesis